MSPDSFHPLTQPITTDALILVIWITPSSFINVRFLISVLIDEWFLRLWIIVTTRIPPINYGANSYNLCVKNLNLVFYLSLLHCVSMSSISTEHFNMKPQLLKRRPWVVILCRSFLMQFKQCFALFPWDNGLLTGLAQYSPFSLNPWVVSWLPVILIMFGSCWLFSC